MRYLLQMEIRAVVVSGGGGIEMDWQETSGNFLGETAVFILMGCGLHSVCIHQTIKLNKKKRRKRRGTGRGEKSPRRMEKWMEKCGVKGPL